jgi:ABC-type multidrug transport system fused ATPase/permease subunit
MTLARVGRRTAESILRGARRSTPAAPGTSRFRPGNTSHRWHPAKPGLGPGAQVRDGSSSAAAAAASAARRASGGGRAETRAATFAAIQELTRSPAARRFARALVGGATVAGVVGGGLALCDASGAPADALRSFFGAPRVGPGGGAGADAGDDANALTAKETTDRRYEDGDDDAASSSDAAAETSAADPPLDGRRLLLQLAATHWPALLLAVVVTVVASVLKLTSLRHMSRLYDLIGAATGGVPLRPLLELAALRAAEAAAKYALVRVSGAARVAMETALRRRLFVALLTEDMATLERRTAGECRERLGGEASRVADVVARALTGGVKSCATAVHGVASLTRLSWEISAVALGMVPPGVLLFGAVGAFSAKAHRDAAAAKEAAASVAAERLAGARTVRAFAREEAEEARYAEALRVAAAAKSRAIHAHAAHLALFAAVPSTAVAAWLWYGGQLVQQGRLTVGELTTVVPLALEVAGALAGLSELSAEVQRGAHAADNAARVLNAEQKVETRVRRRMEARLDVRHDSAPASPASSAVSRRESNESSDDAVVAANRPRGAISFRDVRFAYPGRPEREVLRGFDLDLKPGETFALVGPSGGGKSTVGALLSRFYDPVAGAVFLDGRDIKTLDVSWLRANIGTVSQDVTLFDGTIAETITYASDASDRESRGRADVVAAADVANARGFIEAFPDGYDTRVGENGALLSGGQKQRLAIARVVLSNPAILLLDEATSALDAQSEASVSEALSRAAEGRTTILVAHRLATARRADRIGVLKDGRLVECGTHEQLMKKTNGAYRALVETQLQA